jgi:hypothetical protein
MTQISHPNQSSPREGRFSPTSLETACPRKYYLEKIQGMKKKGQANCLLMGTAVHAFVEEWQKLRIAGEPEETLLAKAILASLPVAQASVPSWPGDKYSIENWLFTCEAYHYRWKGDGYIPLKTECISWIPMPNGTMLGGVMDALFQKPNGALVIRDTKTTGSKITDWFWNGMSNKLQLSLYYKMISQLFPDRDILGVEIDAVVLTNKRNKEDDLFQRRLYERTDLQIADALNTYLAKTNFITKGLTDANPISYFYQEQSQCSAYGGCQFLPICTYGLNHPSVQTDFQLDDSGAGGPDSDGV